MKATHWHVDDLLLRGGVIAGHPEYYTNLCAHLSLLVMVRDEVEPGWEDAYV